MTTNTITRPTEATCPPWCTLTPDHGWDSIVPETGTEIRGHGGPTFGKYLSGFGEETSEAPGAVRVGITLYASEYDTNDLTPAQLLDLAADAVSAAAWLESVR